jgi:hypothetical protein
VRTLCSAGTNPVSRPVASASAAVNDSTRQSTAKVTPTGSGSAPTTASEDTRHQRRDRQRRDRAERKHRKTLGDQHRDQRTARGAKREAHRDFA